MMAVGDGRNMSPVRCINQCWSVYLPCWDSDGCRKLLITMVVCRYCIISHAGNMQLGQLYSFIAALFTCMWYSFQKRVKVSLSTPWIHVGILKVQLHPVTSGLYGGSEGRTPVPTGYEDGWATRPFCTSLEKRNIHLALTGIRTPYRLTSSLIPKPTTLTLTKWLINSWDSKTNWIWHMR